MRLNAWINDLFELEWEGGSMKKRIKNTCLTFLAVLLAGYLFIDRMHWYGCTESAILYLAAVIGAGFCWLGSGHGSE